MVEEQQPAKRVVKRVVKKTVVRPGQPADAPKVRYGRPVATATKPKAKVASRPPASTAARPTTVRRPRTNVNAGPKLRAAGGRLRDTGQSLAGAVGHGARGAAGFAVARAKVVAAWRLPHINLYLASVITGAVVGLVSVGLGFVALSIFESVRGVSSGGGLWGGIAFTGIAVVAIVLGESLLRGFGSHAGRLTSLLAVVLTIVAMLGLFLGLVDSWAALIVLPALGAAAFTLSHWLIDLAESTPPVVE